jgi:cyanate permease
MFSTLYGLTWTAYAIAGATGPVLMGRVFDATSSYASLLVFLSSITAISALLMLLLPRYPVLPDMESGITLDEHAPAPAM